MKNEIRRSCKNQNTMWKCLNKILPAKNKQSISNEIVFETLAISNEYEISNKFNEFFIKSIADINSQIPSEAQMIEIKPPTHLFKFKHINVEKLIIITKNLTKK